jgi:hypothetical protein
LCISFCCLVCFLQQLSQHFCLPFLLPFYV